MAVLGYARVSTVLQAREGDSLESQARQLRGYAELLGVELGQIVVEDGISGSMPVADRPKAGPMLASLQRGDVLITAKLDRLFRNAADALATLAALKEKGVSLHMIDLGGDVTSNGVSRLVFTILSAVAENERDRIRERISTTKADQRAQGRYLGGRAPFGYTVDGDYVVEDPAMQKELRRMRRMRAGGATLRAVAAEMKARGVRISVEGVRAALARASL